MISPETSLFQYGAIGIILTAILGLFLWAFKRLFSHVLDQQSTFMTYMDENIKAMHGIQTQIEKGNMAILERMQQLADRNWEVLMDQRSSRR